MRINFDFSLGDKVSVNKKGKEIYGTVSMISIITTDWPKSHACVIYHVISSNKETTCASKSNMTLVEHGKETRNFIETKFDVGQTISFVDRDQFRKNGKIESVNIDISKYTPKGFVFYTIYLGNGYINMIEDELDARKAVYLDEKEAI